MHCKIILNKVSSYLRHQRDILTIFSVEPQICIYFLRTQFTGSDPFCTSACDPSKASLLTFQKVGYKQTDKLFDLLIGAFIHIWPEKSAGRFGLNLKKESPIYGTLHQWHHRIFLRVGEVLGGSRDHAHTFSRKRVTGDTPLWSLLQQLPSATNANFFLL